MNLSFRHPDAGTLYSPGHRTDAMGRFTFEGLSTGVGEYWATIDRGKGVSPIKARWNLEGEPVRLVMPD